MGVLTYRMIFAKCMPVILTTLYSTQPWEITIVPTINSVGYENICAELEQYIERHVSI